MPIRNPLTIARQLRRELGDIHRCVRHVEALATAEPRAGVKRLEGGGNNHQNKRNERETRRRTIARAYLRGSGIEIGAAHQPLSVPPGVTVRYVDWMSREDMIRHFPKLRDAPLVTPDIVDDGERLGKIPDASVDFVIASHFIEHCEDPVNTLKNFFRVLRRAGLIFLAVPDKRYTRDRPRPITTLDHLIADHEHGPERSRLDHYKELQTLQNFKSEAEKAEQLTRMLEEKRRIHFHVWNHHAFLEFMIGIQARYAFPFEIQLAARNGMENIFILQRLPS